MPILGIDYGKVKLGLAIAIGTLAEPYLVIRFKNPDEVLEKIGLIIKKENIEKVVVGISEQQMAKESWEFGQRLSERLKITVETYDETLTTQEAQKKAIEAGIKRKKRRALEDAFAAAVMLQLFIDSHV